MKDYPSNCNCIQGGGNGTVVLRFIDCTIPWRCPKRLSCTHLKAMADNLPAPPHIGSNAAEG